MTKWKVKVVVEAENLIEAYNKVSKEVEVVSIEKEENFYESERNQIQEKEISETEVKSVEEIIGKNLISLWKRYNISAEEFLHRCSLNGKSQSDILGCAYKMRTAEFEKVCKSLNISPVALTTEGACSVTLIDTYPKVSSMTLTEILGINIIDARKRLNMTVEELSKKSGVKVVNSIEQGACVSIGLERVQYIANTLGVSVSDLFKYEPAEKAEVILPMPSISVIEPDPEIEKEEIKEEEDKIIPSNEIISSKDPNIVLGENIKKFRDWKGMSQKSFSKLVGWEMGEISQIERGVYKTSLKKVRKIAKGMNISFSLLFREDLDGFDLSNPLSTFDENEDILATIANNCKRERNEMNFSVSELSERAGVTPSLIYKIEGRKIENILLNSLKSISKNLNITMSSFLMER